jgi:hypothetical protein
MAELCTVSLPKVTTLQLSLDAVQDACLDKHQTAHSKRRVLARARNQFVDWDLHPALLPKLESLSIGRWPVLGSRNFHAICRDFPKLKTLHLHDVHRITPSDLITVVCPANLPCLEELTIGFLGDTKDSFLAELLGGERTGGVKDVAGRKWPHLKSFTLEWMHRYIDNLIQVAAASSGFEGLEYLCLRGNFLLGNFWGMFVDHPIQFAKLASLIVEHGTMELPLFPPGPRVILPGLKLFRDSYLVLEVVDFSTGALLHDQTKANVIWNKIFADGHFHPEFTRETLM